MGIHRIFGAVAFRFSEAILYDNFDVLPSCGVVRWAAQPCIINLCDKCWSRMPLVSPFSHPNQKWRNNYGLLATQNIRMRIKNSTDQRSPFKISIIKCNFDEKSGLEIKFGSTWALMADNKDKIIFWWSLEEIYKKRPWHLEVYHANYWNADEQQ